MGKLSFRNLRFSEEEKGVKVTFLEHFHFIIPDEELLDIGKFRIEQHAIDFPDKRNPENKFGFLLEKHFRKLRSNAGKPATYIHSASGIPLLGSNEFGIVDRATNMIELKPITLCNIDCIYCSVNQSRRELDFVVEEEYLIEELEPIIALKENLVNIHIGGQGEPTMYADLDKLVADLRANKKVQDISIATNGTMISVKRADELIKAGLTHFHISLNAFSKDMADTISCRNYPLEQVKKACEHIAKNAKLIIAPVYIPSINDEEIEKLIEFSKSIRAPILIQNFLEYRFGRRPVNPLPMKVFFQKLDELGEKYGVDLTSLPEPIIVPDKALGKPFRKGQVVTAEVVGKTRIKGSCLAVAEGRVITVPDCMRKGRIKVRIIRDKDSIFTGVIA